jgi:hypothetical protein
LLEKAGIVSRLPDGRARRPLPVADAVASGLCPSPMRSASLASPTGAATPSPPDRIGRLVDYPSAFVPVMSGRDPGSTEAVGQIDVLDKAALNARLAHSYLVELKERARIV